MNRYDPQVPAPLSGTAWAPKRGRAYLPGSSLRRWFGERRQARAVPTGDGGRAGLARQRSACVC